MTKICSNCYTGCASITSDKCVKYTGLDNEILGIQNGDSVNYVASALIGFLTAVLNGQGIKFELDPEKTCALVDSFLADCGDATIVDITNALAQAICTLDGRVDALEAAEVVLEDPYDTACMPSQYKTDTPIDPTTPTSDTHEVLQNVIYYLCSVATDLNALESNVATNYVLIADINTYIQTYLDSLDGGSTTQKDKMVPYTVVEYWGSLSYFDASGAGTGDWVEIYLCNGENGTPDKRGRVTVGATTTPGGLTMENAVDPTFPGNPTYGLEGTYGSNMVTLTTDQMPSHTHANVTTLTPATHDHTYTDYTLNATTYDRPNGSGQSGGELTKQTTSVTISANTIIDANGGGEGHSNVQPTIACYYIMYIPS